MTLQIKFTKEDPHRVYRNSDNGKDLKVGDIVEVTNERADELIARGNFKKVAPKQKVNGVKDAE